MLISSPHAALNDRGDSLEGRKRNRRIGRKKTSSKLRKQREGTMQGEVDSSFSRKVGDDLSSTRKVGDDLSSSSSDS